jgi:CubicO group peptidase (beta-lactamase class C family)
MLVIKLLASLLALGFSLSLGFGQAAQPAGVDIDEKVDAFVQAEMHAAQIPGLTLGIVHGDQLVHLRGFGVADPTGRAPTGQTPFLLASLSKSFTSLAIMQLVESGRLELDAPVQRYLPWFGVADPDASAQMTLRNLLNHRSGISTLSGWAPLTGNGEATLEQLVRDLRSAPLAHGVGEQYEYSNANYWALGLVIQQVSGEPYAQYVERHIFAPLQMRHSFVSEEPAAADGLAMGYQTWFGWHLAAHPPYQSGSLPSGSLISSAEDMSHFVIAQLNGGRFGDVRLVSAAGIEELHRPAAPFGTSLSYAMGWVVGSTDGAATVWHNGGVSNYNSDVVLVPDQGWGVVVLTNQGGLPILPATRIGDGVASLLLGHDPPPPARFDFRTSYVLTDAALGLGVLVWLWSLAGLLHLRRTMAHGVRRPRLVRDGLAPLARDLFIPLLAFAIVPALVGAPLTVTAFSLPDVSIALLIEGALLLLVAGARVAVLALSLRTPRYATQHHSPVAPPAASTTSVAT